MTSTQVLDKIFSSTLLPFNLLSMMECQLAALPRYGGVLTLSLPWRRRLWLAKTSAVEVAHLRVPQNTSVDLPFECFSITFGRLVEPQ